jgi:hypothetical protein
MQHVRVDDDDRFSEVISGSLNECLNVEANIDQTGTAFIQDVVMSMLDEGVVAIVPTDMDMDPKYTSGFHVESVRTGRIMDWRPTSVLAMVYNEQTGLDEQIDCMKKTTGIIENPFFAIMNDRNSILSRLVDRLRLLDVVSAQSNSGKLDIIMQLPYVVKSDARKEQADRRLEEIARQLEGSKYGIAYADATEKITQLNRPAENTLMSQIEFLKNTLFEQLGLTPEVMNGSANESTMLNYYKRTINPILNAITEELDRKFLSKTARTQKQAIRYYRDPFELTPSSEIADIADKMTRNAILTSNDVRSIVGFKPNPEPVANELSNKNMPVQDQGLQEPPGTEDPEDAGFEIIQPGTEGGG